MLLLKFGLMQRYGLSLGVCRGLFLFALTPHRRDLSMLFLKTAALVFQSLPFRLQRPSFTRCARTLVFDTLTLYRKLGTGTLKFSLGIVYIGDAAIELGLLAGQRGLAVIQLPANGVERGALLLDVQLRVVQILRLLAHGRFESETFVAKSRYMSVQLLLPIFPFNLFLVELVLEPLQMDGIVIQRFAAAGDFLCEAVLLGHPFLAIRLKLSPFGLQALAFG
jgi:hypothetical protein